MVDQQVSQQRVGVCELTLARKLDSESIELWHKLNVEGDRKGSFHDCVLAFLTQHFLKCELIGFVECVLQRIELESLFKAELQVVGVLFVLLE